MVKSINPCIYRHMTFLKLFLVLIFLATFLAVLFFQLNNKSKPINPIVKRTSLENLEVLRLPSTDEEEIFMEALVRGKLFIENNCLKIDVLGSDTVYTLVWRSLFKIEIKNEALVVTHGNKVVGQEGVSIELSGGEAPDIAHLHLASLQQCNHPPFWLVGAEMRFLK